MQFKDGTKLEERVLDPKGEGENPMTDDDLTHKFMSNCRPLLGEQKCARVLQTVWSLGRSADLKELYLW